MVADPPYTSPPANDANPNDQDEGIPELDVRDVLALAGLTPKQIDFAVASLDSGVIKGAYRLIPLHQQPVQVHPAPAGATPAQLLQHAFDTGASGWSALLHGVPPSKRWLEERQSSPELEAQRHVAEQAHEEAEELRRKLQVEQMARTEAEAEAKKARADIKRAGAVARRKLLAAQKARAEALRAAEEQALSEMDQARAKAAEQLAASQIAEETLRRDLLAEQTARAKAESDAEALRRQGAMLEGLPRHNKTTPKPKAATVVPLTDRTYKHSFWPEAFKVFLYIDTSKISQCEAKGLGTKADVRKRLRQMAADKGMSVDPSVIFRWVGNHTPKLKN